MTHHDDEFDKRHDLELLLNQRLSHIPLPVGVIESDDWLSITEGDVAIRAVTWSVYASGEYGAAVIGYQYSDDGRVENEISLYGANAAIDAISADDARRIAWALLEAADALESLT